MIALQWYETRVERAKGQTCKGGIRLNVVAKSEDEARSKTKAMFGNDPSISVNAVIFKPLESWVMA